MDKKIIFLYTGGHPVHLDFAKSIKADIKKLSWKLPKDYDIYLTEGGFVKVIILRMFGLINRKIKIINLFTDPRLFYLNKKIFLDLEKDKVKKYPEWRLFLSKILVKKLDGAICVGEFEEELLKKITKKVPSEVVYPFTTDKRYNNFQKIKNKYSNKNLLFIGNGPDYYYKGVDILIETFKIAREKIPELKLYIVGYLRIKKEWRVDGVYFKGKKKDISNYLKNSSLYVHMGRGEAFGITILKAMLAGIPTLVSEYTGAKEVLEKVDKDFISPLNKNLISKRIINYFNLNLKKKKTLSKKSRITARKFDEKEMLRSFKEKFQVLLREAYHENSHN